MLADLKKITRQFARVDPLVVSQVDDTPTVGDVSDETLALRDAFRVYSRIRPWVQVVDIPAPGSYEIELSTVITDWHPDTHQVHRVWWPTGYQQIYQIDAANLSVYQKAGGAWWLKFLVVTPGVGTISIEFSGPHDLATDTVSANAPSDVEAVCHLAAANVLRMAANYFAKQHSNSLSADVSNTEQQSFNYAMRAKDEEQKFNSYVGTRRGRTSVRANLNQARKGESEMFWHRGRLP